MYDLLHSLAVILALTCIGLHPHCTNPDRLQASAPAYIDEYTAPEHTAAADLAAFVTATDPADLLSIAWHESRYVQRAVTREPGNRWSCGVMTPAPTHDFGSCMLATESLLAGYLAGAVHLREWLIVCRGDRHCALRGYAGAARSRCNIDPDRACRAAWEFERRARVIR
jgi:hypothetical protein